MSGPCECSSVWDPCVLDGSISTSLTMAHVRTETPQYGCVGSGIKWTDSPEGQSVVGSVHGCLCSPICLCSSNI